MIIRQEKARSRIWRRGLIAVFILSALGAGAYALRKQLDQKIPVEAAFFDMETVGKVGSDSVLLGTHGAIAKGFQKQSTAMARSGRHSLELSSKHEFGADYCLEDVNGGDVIEIRAWINKSNETGKIIVDGSWELYQPLKPTGKTEANGWEEYGTIFKVPDFVRDAKMKVYCWNPSEFPAYFDDLYVHRHSTRHYPTAYKILASDSVAKLNLIIPDKGMEKLLRIRDEALRKGVIATKEDAWVKARLDESGHEWRGAVRLKGDWTDHIERDRWSYRMTLSPGQAWRRMVTFSFQSPHTRFWLAEWVFHQWMEHEDILCPRYDFVELQVNGRSKGIYAYEEHFEKQLVEYKHRREGPIMKFNEEGFWELAEEALALDGMWNEHRVPEAEASVVDAFRLKATLKDSTLYGNFKQAQELMEGYRWGKKSIWDLFDAKKMATYFALLDVSQAFHGLVWHNQRFYYNPVISKLEPIGFDGYTEYGPVKWLGRPFMGHGRNLRFINEEYKEQMFSRFFQDPKFIALYVQELFRLTDPAYLHSFFMKIEPALFKREAWLRLEFADYVYDRGMLFSEAKLLRTTMMPQKLSSVVGHQEGKSAKGYRFTFLNYHCLPVTLLGVGAKETKMDAPFSQPAFCDAYVAEFPAEFVQLEAATQGKFVFFSIPGIDSIFSAPINPWPAPGVMTTEQLLFAEARIVPGNGLYEVDSVQRQLTFHAGLKQSSKDIIIPAGWQVRFNAGAQLDLVQKAKFISKSQVIISGSEAAPVRIFSSDHSANGFTVLQSPGKCDWRNAIFEHLNTLNYKGWKLTGAVTLYECDVRFEKCSFVNNHCEDALNTVRCLFEFYDSYVGYTAGDGFDADFCRGSVREGHFSHTANDGMDFSGSTITIYSADIDAAGDKGISLGEESTVLVKEASIYNSVIGIAAKDMTTVTVNFIRLKGNQTAFACYQKKPEYGPGQITVTGETDISGNKQLHLLQEGSTLVLDSITYKGRL
jgi:hypothetical protein